MVDKNKIKSEIRWKKAEGWLNGTKFCFWAVVGLALTAVIGLLVMAKSGVDAAAETNKIDSAKNFTEAQEMKKEAIETINKENKEWLKGAANEAQKFNEEGKRIRMKENKNWYSFDEEENAKERLSDFVEVDYYVPSIA